MNHNGLKHGERWASLFSVSHVKFQKLSDTNFGLRKKTFLKVLIETKSVC